MSSAPHLFTTLGLAAFAALLPAVPAHAAGDTQTTVLRPVDRTGNPAPGWTVDTTHARESADGCAASSSHAVTPGVYDCGASALDGDACWPTATSANLLCLIDPYRTTLTMYTAGGPIADKPAPADPTPIALTLDDGTHCRARVGGSWGRQVTKPDYVGYFRCTGNGGDAGAVWGPRDVSAGIDKGAGAWTVQEGTGDGPLVTHTVTTAYFVGTA